MTVRSTAVVALILLLVLRAAAAPQPVVRPRADGMLTITLPPALLAQRDVRRQLGSGLTTTFLVQVTAGRRKGAARVEIRFEPWDEIYFVTTRGIDGAAQTIRQPSLERLTEWWRNAALPVLPRAAGVKDVQISLDVLPFSIEEQKETQRWLTRSLGEAHNDRALDPDDVAERAGGSSVLDVLIGTSIQRRPILRYRWNVAVTR